MILCLLLAFPSVEGSNEVSVGIQKFTTNIIHSIDIEAGEDNFLFSPFSLHSTLSQVLIGAGGRTQAELEHALGVTRSRSLATQYSQIHDNLSFLKIANILALNKGFSPKQIFMDFIKKGFGTKINEYDFNNEKLKSLDEINSIVESTTNRRITNLLSPTDVDESLKMMLINAIYFKAKWKQSFNLEDSFSSIFKSHNDGNVMTKFMTTKMKARLDETEYLEILELPYTDGLRSMVLFLPKSPHQPRETIIDSIFEYPTKNLKKMPTTMTTISIPSFKIKHKANVKSLMSGIGVSNMFSQQANFSYISNQQLKVSDGVHKAFIDVNEEGTEAAAATVSLFSFKSASLERRFFANRPFYFMVYDFHNELPIFVGSFANPSKARGSQLKSSVPTSSQAAEINQNVKESDENKDCMPYISLFSAALQNKKECSYKGYRPSTWFTKNKSSCMTSQEVYKEFIARECEEEWCDYATGQYKQWEDMYATQCTFGQTEASSCKQIIADLKAWTALDCKF